VAVWEEDKMIYLENVYKKYIMGTQVVNALNGITLQIDRHEFVAVVGPSGSGKSTLMNIIGCLDTPTSGTYILDGYDVCNISDNQLAEFRNRKLGFVFQQFNLLQKLTAIENVELPLVYQGLGKKARRKRALEALESVGLSDRINHKPSELSGGQQQRVAIARALVTNPPIILADEPTGALDSKSGAEIMKIIKLLNEAGSTIVLITHDNTIASQAKRIIRISDGSVVEDRMVV